MNRTALTNIAPDIFRKRLLIEGYFQSNMAESVLRDYFRHITSELGLRTYGDLSLHRLDHLVLLGHLQLQLSMASE